MEWIKVEDQMPEILEDGESELVLCLGFKMSPERADTAEYEIMRWIYLHKPDLLDSKGRPVKYGWSRRWWNTNPDLYGVFYWMPLPSPPEK